MTQFIRSLTRRFLRSEDGSMVVPFALWVPVIITMLVSTIEMGTVTIRHSALERALDQTVRSIRLSPGTTFTHSGIKTEVCDRAVILPSCSQLMHLEMLVLDMHNYTAPSSDADCVDLARTVTPVREFSNGDENQVLFLRACYKYDPVSPAGYLGGTMQTDLAGYIGLITTNSFVIEPE